MNEKVKSFFKNYVYSIISVCIALVYILRSLIYFDNTGKTVWEIIADGLIIMIFGILIDFLMGAQGINSGKKVKEVEDAEKRHTELVRAVGSRADEMQDFCDRKNVAALQAARKQILIENGYRYADFFEQDGTVKAFPTIDKEPKKDRKRRYRAYKKARDFRITMLNVPLLTTDRAATKDVNEIGRSINRFMIGQTRNDIIWKIMISLFVGLFSAKLLKDISLENVIYTVLQSVMLIGVGMMKYFTSKFYITREYKDRVERKNLLLEEFKNTIKEDEQNVVEEEQTV